MKIEILKNKILSDDRKEVRQYKVIKTLREIFKLKDLLEYFNFTKSTYKKIFIIQKNNRKIYKILQLRRDKGKIKISKSGKIQKEIIAQKMPELV